MSSFPGGTSPSKRRDMDMMKLMMSNYKVKMNDDDGKFDFCVEFRGPEETAYAGGVYKVHVELPLDYPYRSPSIGFVNKVYHPNVDWTSGSVCLDVINQTWSPMFDLVNVFDHFIPQLLRYPNPSDPLNGEAAALLLKDPEKYAEKVKEYVKKHATASEENEDDKMDCEDDELSELSDSEPEDLAADLDL